MQILIEHIGPVTAHYHVNLCSEVFVSVETVLQCKRKEVQTDN
jgi:hypothetical protein